MLGLVVVLGSLIAVGAILKLVSTVRRGRLSTQIPEDAIVRQARGASMRVLIDGPPIFPGMSTSKANRTLGDLILTADRLLLVCNRGKLLDLGEAHGRKLASARCTGPGRLVLEGEHAVPTGPIGRYRIEVSVDDAPAWATALTPFVEPGQQAFASWAG